MSDIELNDEIPSVDPASANKKMKTTFKVDQFIDPRQMKSDLSYSTADLSSAMMQQASLFAHYGVLASQAARQVDVIKMLLETTEAAVYRVIRDKAIADGEKVTEALLEKRVARHEKVLSLKKALVEAKQIEANGKIAVESFRHRRDMLVQHGLISREEMKGELAIAVKKEREAETASFLERRQARLNGNSDA